MVNAFVFKKAFVGGAIASEESSSFTYPTEGLGPQPTKWIRGLKSAEKAKGDIVVSA